MASKSRDSLDHWRKFFQNADADIFYVLEQAIRVAATDHPKEFRSRRDQFAEHLLIFKLRSRCSSSGSSKEEEEKNSNNSSSVDSRKMDDTVTVTESLSITGSLIGTVGDVVSVVVDEEEKFRATMENSKRKLREGYQRFENAKKLRRVQVMDFKDLPNPLEIGRNQKKKIN